MTTKKKNTPSDHKSKAEVEAQRVAELWGPSSPNFSEMLETLLRFRDGLDDALVAVDRFVSEAKRVSDELRKEGSDMAADLLSGLANERAGVTSVKFYKDAQRVVDVVFSALLTGSPTHLHELERVLFDRGRGRAEWLRLCSSYRELLITSLWRPSSEDHDVGLLEILEHDGIRVSQRLIDLLTQIDDRAEALVAKQVREVAATKTTETGFAAKLACMCKAFNYDWEAEAEKQPEGEKDPKKAQEDVQDKAQRAFARVVKKEAK